jgi:L-iditol 2-dehydrogenase
MEAYYIEAPGKIKQLKKDIPSCLKDEVLIRVAFIGICGSDMQLHKGSYGGPSKYPILFGHEWSGIVEKVGETISTLKKGDKVTGDCSKFCGECENCKVDKNLCFKIEKFGLTIDGASSEYIVRREKYLYKAPEDMNLELLCLAEPVAVAYHLINKIFSCASELEQKKILIMGAGSIGLSALMLLLKQFKCKSISQFDISKNRLALAKKLGAQILSQKDLIDTTSDANYAGLYAKPKFDVVIESTGAPEAFSASLNLVKPMGIVGCIGMAPQVQLNLKVLVAKALFILGSIGGTGEFLDSIDFINRNPEYVRQIISHRFPINEAHKALALGSHADDTLKVLLEF